MKKPTRIIINILSSMLIVLMLFSFIPITYLIRPRSYNRINLAGFYAEKENSLDMVYIGGSAAFVFWEALTAFNNYGFTSYSYAHDSITPQSPRYYVEEILKTQNPEVILIDLRPFQYGEDIINGVTYWEYEPYIRNGTDNMPYTSTRYNLVKTSTKNKNNAFSFHFDFLKYKSLLAEHIPSLLTNPNHYAYIDNKASYGYKGFYFVYKTNPLTFTDHSHVVAKKELKGETKKYFFELLDYCKSRNVKPLFIVHSYIQEEEHKMKYNYMKEVIESYGFDFLNTNDYYTEINLDYTKDLYDQNHVNIFGADKYTAFVSKYLKENYNLPDKRNDPEYSEWHSLYESFESASDYAKFTINKIIEEQG